MFRHLTMRRIVLVCSSCDAVSMPCDVKSGPITKRFDEVDRAFSKIGWLVDAEGAWCPACKGMPR